MTKELLSATRDNFTAASGNDEQAQRLQRIYRVLKREGLYNWRVTPFTRDGFVPKMAAVFGLSQIGSAETEKLTKFLEAQTGGRSDAAIDDLYTALGRARPTGTERKRIVDGWTALWNETWAGVALAQEIEAIRGPQTISLTWDMDRARFTIRVIDDSDASTKEMQTTIAGIVRFAFDRQARNLIVSVRPAQMPITSGRRDIQSADGQPVQPRLGAPVKRSDERVEGNGNASGKSEVDEDKKETGKGETSLEVQPGKQEQIDANHRQIEEIKEEKVYVWENPETGEKIRQKRFRKLKEPFEYRGADYADPDGTEKIEQLEREIAALEKGEAPPPETKDDKKNKPADKEGSGTGTGTKQPGGGTGIVDRPTGTGLLQFDKSHYVAGETITVRYPGTRHPEGGFLYSVNITNSCGSWHPTTQDRNVPVFRVIPVVCGGRNYVDVAFKLYKQGVGPIGPVRRFRIRPYLETFPAGLSLPGERAINYGDSLRLQVRVPEIGQITRPGTATGIYEARVRLYELGMPVHGGRVTADTPVREWVVKGAQSLDISPTSVHPRIYELRLEVAIWGKGWGGFFVIDRERFAGLQKPQNRSIKLLGGTTIKAGESAKFVFDGEANRAPAGSGMNIRIHRIDEQNGRRVRDGGGGPRMFRPGRKVNVSMRRSGTHVAQLYYWGPSYRTMGYLVDSLTFRVGGRTEYQRTAALSVGARTVFKVGSEVPVTVRTEGLLAGVAPDVLKDTVLRVRLSKAKSQDDVSGKLLKSWPVKLDEERAWLVEEKLTPGMYWMKLEADVAGKKNVLRRIYFYVMPQEDLFDFSNRGPFVAGETITVPLDGAGVESLLPALSLTLTGLGGFVPGCAYGVGPYYRKQNLTGQSRMSLKAPETPGIYLLRLTFLGRIIHEARLEVIAPPFPETTISLSGSVFRAGETMRLSFDIGKGFYRLNDKEPLYRWYIFRPGSVFEGGALRFPKVYRETQDTNFRTLRHNATYRAPGKSGIYEVRLYYSGHYGRYQHIYGTLLARKRFSVQTDDWPAPDLRPQGATEPSDLPASTYPFPPLGEYLDAKDCKGPFKIEDKPEKMKLRFVRWEDGRYLPIEGALDFGAPIYLEGKLEEEARRDAYFAQIEAPDGAAEDVVLIPSEDDLKIVRSELLYFIWDSEPDAADPRY